MRVIVLASAIGQANTGIGHYSRQLLEHLVPALSAKGCEIWVILPRDGVLPSTATGDRIIRLPAGKHQGMRRICAEQVYVPLVSWRSDVFISLDSQFPLTPIFAKRKLVVVHDIHPIQHLLMPHQYPGDYSMKYLLWAYLSMRRAIRAADHIVTDSTFIARELERVLAVARSRMSVIHCGIDGRRFQRVDDSYHIQLIRERYKLPQDFYLFVGPPGIRKNLRLIVEAYSHKREMDGDVFLPVVAVGNAARTWYEPTIEVIRRYGLGNSFVFLDYVPDSDLPYLYSLARAFLCPSLYEGFGFPPLEAMACGTPVVASDRGSLPEIVGDAALIIEPTRYESLIEALVTINRKDVRKTLIERGVEHVKCFSWERAAEKMAELVLGEA